MVEIFSSGGSRNLNDPGSNQKKSVFLSDIVQKGGGHPAKPGVLSYVKIKLIELIEFISTSCTPPRVRHNQMEVI